MGERFSWPFDGDLRLEEQWSSPNAQFFRYRASDLAVIVKAGTNWGLGDAHRVHDELNRLKTLLSPLGIVVPGPLGWSDEKNLVAMDEVSGTELIKRVIPQRSYLAWGVEVLERLVALCGQALAAYHASQPAPHSETVSAGVNQDIRRAAVRSLIRPSVAQGRMGHLPVARGFRFSANDFLTDGERLVLVDPPHLVRHDLIQRDLSSFTFEVERALRLSGDPDPGLNRSIRNWFLESYGRQLFASAGWEWNSAPETGNWAISLYEVSRITGMVSNQMKAGRVRAAAAGLRWAWERRRNLKSRPRLISNRQERTL